MSLWKRFKEELNQAWSGLDFWDKEENRRQREAAARPKPQVAPRPAAPLLSVRGVGSFLPGGEKPSEALGIGFKDFVAELPSATTTSIKRAGDVGKVVFESPLNIYRSLDYAEEEREQRKKLEKGEITHEQYKAIVDPLAEKAGFKLEDKGGEIARKVGADVAGTALDVLTMKAASAVKGATTGAKVIKGAKTGTKLGASYGTVSGLRQDDPTPKSVATSAAIGAATGGTLGAAVPAVAAPAKKLVNVFRKADAVAPPLKVQVGDDLAKNPKINTQVKTVKAGQLDFGNDTLKTDLDENIVRKYVKDIQKGKPIQPLEVTNEGGKVLIQDGKHRLTAMEALGVDDIPVVTRQTVDLADATKWAKNYGVKQETVDKLINRHGQQNARAVLERSKVATNIRNKDAFVVGEARKAFGPGDIKIERTIYGGDKSLALPGKMTKREYFSPDRQIRERVTNPAQEKVQKLIYRAQTSENPIARGTGRLIRGVSREAGTPEELLTARRKMFGGQEYGKLVGSDVTKKIGADLDDDALSRVWATLDPDQATKKGINVTLDDLTPDELAAHRAIAEIRDYTTEGNLARGLIDEGQAANQSYLTRRYAPFEELKDYGEAYSSSRSGLLNALKKRNIDVKEELIDQAITDPTYLAGKRLAESQQAWALVDYSNFLAKGGYVSDVARPGFVQLPKSKLFGEAAGKYVPQNIAEDFTGWQYQWGFMNSFNDLITAYDRLGVRQAKKGLLTVGNPAVRMGNQLSNRVVFSTLNGINPVEFNKVMAGTRSMIKNRSPEYLEATRQGLIGTDITNAEFTRRIAETVDDPNIAQQALRWIRTSYSDADDRARLAAFTVHLKQGYSPDQAAKLTQRGFQDYKSVGFFYDLAAKTPIIGNAFVRFAGDAVRIMKNAALDHPLRTAAVIGMWSTFVNGMSRLSGETPEDKATRETRFGSPKIPFTNISLTVQTPIGELNLARFMPFYQLNEVEGQIGRFLPIQANPLKPQGWNDPLLGQFAQIIADKDFRGKSIQDPDNTVYWGEGDQAVKKYPDLPADEKRSNVYRFLRGQNLPLGREIDSVTSAFRGEEDIYGKERSPTQALLRAGGIKIEEYGPEQAKEQRERDQYFEGNVERVKAFLAANPDLAQSYYKFSNPTRDRVTGVKTSDLIGPERWTVVRSDASGKLFNFLKSEALLANKEDKRPVDPIFQLPTPEQARQVLEIRSRPSGDDIETEEILRATTDWYEPFEKAEGKFYDASAKYWESKDLGDNKQNQRVKEYGALYDKMYPQQTGLIKQYYQAKGESIQGGKDFFKAHADQLSADFDKYRSDKLKYINARRKIEGFPPISAQAFNNVTFGYEDDEKKVYDQLKFEYGGGYGRGGRGGSGGGGYVEEAQVGSPGSAPSPKVSKSTRKVKVIAKSKSKPGVITVKRSKTA